jgi:hypothetical protein
VVRRDDIANFRRIRRRRGIGGLQTPGAASQHPRTAVDAAALDPTALDTPAIGPAQPASAPSAVAASPAETPRSPPVQRLTLEEADAQVAARMIRIQSQIDASVAAAEASRRARPSQAAAPVSDNTAPAPTGNAP